VITTVERVREHLPVATKDLHKGLQKVKQLTGLHGRWEIISKKPRTICDTGHNKEGINEVLKCVAREYKSRIVKGKLRVIFGVVNDKDLSSVFKLLSKDKYFKTAQYYFCKPAIPRGLEAQELVESAAKFGLRGKIYSSVKKALAAARSEAKTHELVFVGGSTFTVAEVV
jgi:dihydrofolate synthase/folylpolyglutamate synthase